MSSFIHFILCLTLSLSDFVGAVQLHDVKTNRVFEETVDGYTFKVQFGDDGEERSDEEAKVEDEGSGQSMQQAEVNKMEGLDSRLTDAEVYPAGLRWNHTIAELAQITNTTQSRLDRLVKGIENLPPQSHSFRNTIIPM